LFLDEIGELGLDEQAMLLRALEGGVFLPLGSDREVKSEFQLIAGTNRDLHARAREGRFREDLLARIDAWTFRLPGLAERTEDIAPNLEYELHEFSRVHGSRLSFSTEARERFLSFATSAQAAWRGNFRDLNCAVMRLGTLARGGRVTVDDVDAEIARLQSIWREPGHEHRARPAAVLRATEGKGLDRFDAAQLEEVVRVCQESQSLSDAGRKLFAVSRSKKASPNDADRLRKYLARFGLSWASISSGGAAALEAPPRLRARKKAG